MIRPADDMPDDLRDEYDEEICRVYLEESPRLRRHLMRKGASAELADDVMQDAFMATRLRWRVVRSYERPVAYVYRVAENRLRRLLGKERGRLPWSPNPAVTDLDVWHEYEVPLVGTFRMDDQTVLFALVGDPNDDLTVWAYRCLSPEEAAAADDLAFESVGELGEHVERMFAHREAVLALAGDLLIREWTPAQVEDGLLPAALVFLKELVRATTLDPLTAFRGAVAEVETVHSDLVDA